MTVRRPAFGTPPQPQQLKLALHLRPCTGRTSISKDRGGALAAVAAIHAALLFAFLNLSGTIDLGRSRGGAERVRHQRSRRRRRRRRRRSSSGSSRSRRKRKAGRRRRTSGARRRRSVAPKPRSRAAAAHPIVGRRDAAPGRRSDPGRRRRARSGDRRGRDRHGHRQRRRRAPARAAAATAAYVEPPRLAHAGARGRDFPRRCSASGRAARRSSCACGSMPRGYVSECVIDRGTGDPIDRFGDLQPRASDRLRFRPALNRSGQAVAGWFGYRADAAALAKPRLSWQRGQPMIEAEWWEYDTLDELADAVAGDVGFIIESALDARGSCADRASRRQDARCRSSPSSRRASCRGRR